MPDKNTLETLSPSPVHSLKINGNPLQLRVSMLRSHQRVVSGSLLGGALGMPFFSSEKGQTKLWLGFALGPGPFRLVN